MGIFLFRKYEIIRRLKNVYNKVYNLSSFLVRKFAQRVTLLNGIGKISGFNFEWDGECADRCFVVFLILSGKFQN
jgi:hypothetical protein